LTYSKHPGKTPLIDFCASEQGIELEDPIPFIFADRMPVPICLEQPLIVSWGFNGTDRRLKEQFVRAAEDRFRDVAQFVRVDDIPWKDAAAIILASKCFIGCRSACAVLAHGLGKTVLSCETVPWRMAKTYSCPYGDERSANLQNLEAILEA
jgi:hypothetical protein